MFHTALSGLSRTICSEVSLSFMFVCSSIRETSQATTPWNKDIMLKPIEPGSLPMKIHTHVIVYHVFFSRFLLLHSTSQPTTMRTPNSHSMSVKRIPCFKTCFSLVIWKGLISFWSLVAGAKKPCAAPSRVHVPAPPRNLASEEPEIRAINWIRMSGWTWQWKTD